MKIYLYLYESLGLYVSIVARKFGYDTFKHWSKIWGHIIPTGYAFFKRQL